MGGFGFGDFASGVGTNAAWDLIKTAFRKTKQELDRRIDPTREHYEFDALDNVVGDALSVLAVGRQTGFGRFSREIQAWLVNLPEGFRRETVCQWLVQATTRASTKALIGKLLLGEDVDTERHALVRTFCTWTGDNAAVADQTVEIVVRFVGETLEGRIVDGDRVIIAATQRVHERIAVFEERITKKLDELQATSREDQQILRAFKLSQRVEKFLRTRFSAQGAGLGELYRSSSPRVRALDLKLATAIAHFAPLRNRLAHEEDPAIDRSDADRLIEELEHALQRHVTQNIADLSLSLRPREAIVCASGLADFTSIAEAIAQAAPGDRIYVQPGRYNESISIEKAISIIGRGESPQDVVVTSDDDDALIIGASDVVIRDLSFSVTRAHAFASVVLPGSTNIQFSSCHFASQAGEGLVGMHASEFVAAECQFDSCRVGVRVDAIGTLTEVQVRSCDHGILIRRGASGAIAQSALLANAIGIEVQDGGTAQIHSNSFEAGAYGIVAVGTAKGRAVGNKFSGYGESDAIAKIDGASDLVVEA